MMTTTMARRPAARPAWHSKPASPKAAAYWASLRNDDRTLEIEALRLAGHDATADVLEADREEWVDTTDLTAGQASQDIDALKVSVPARRAANRRARAAAAVAVEAAGGDIAALPALVADRLYLVDGVAYRTVMGKVSGEMYAKVLNTDTRKWDYAPGAINRIRPEHRMTVEQAEALSDTWSWCIRCGVELKAAESVARSIGPVCITKI